MRIRTTVFACTLAIAGTAGPASADSIIFNNLTPESAFSQFGYFFGWAQENDEDVPQSVSWRAVEFQALETAALGEITMPLSWEQSAPNRGDGSLQVVLYTSENGLPGTPLESFTRTGASPAALTSFDSLLHPQLVAGQSYFLAAQSTGYLDGEWFIASTGDHLETAIREGFNFELGPWRHIATTSTTGFRVTGDPAGAATPEPGTLLLLAGGIAAAWRRQRAARTLSA